MHRRCSVRAQTDVPVSVYANGSVFACRAVDLSTQGVVIERVPGLDHHDARPFYWMKFGLGDDGVLALARPAWKKGRSQAFRFIEISDADRLTLAEEMDRASRSCLSLH